VVADVKTYLSTRANPPPLNTGCAGAHAPSNQSVSEHITPDKLNALFDILNGRRVVKSKHEAILLRDFSITYPLKTGSIILLNNTIDVGLVHGITPISSTVSSSSSSCSLANSSAISLCPISNELDDSGSAPVLNNKKSTRSARTEAVGAETRHVHLQPQGCHHEASDDLEIDINLMQPKVIDKDMDRNKINKSRFLRHFYRCSIAVPHVDALEC